MDLQARRELHLLARHLLRGQALLILGASFLGRECSHMCSHGESFVRVRGDTRRESKRCDQGRRTSTDSGVRNAHVTWLRGWLLHGPDWRLSSDIREELLISRPNRIIGQIGGIYTVTFYGSVFGLGASDDADGRAGTRV